jgi:hypothetical protein
VSGAIREHGISRRPTADVDLFTDDPDPERFGEALDDLVAQLEAEGFRVEVTRRFELFARLRVTVGTEVVEVDLGVDWREREPVVMAIGSVLDELDAVANKVGALYSRAEPRDYIDVDAIRRSGRYSDEALLRAASNRDAGFDRGTFATHLRAIARVGARRVHEYGLSERDLDGVKTRLLAWADAIDAGR